MRRILSRFGHDSDGTLHQCHAKHSHHARNPIRFTSPAYSPECGNNSPSNPGGYFIPKSKHRHQSEQDESAIEAAQA